LEFIIKNCLLFLNHPFKRKISILKKYALWMGGHFIKGIKYVRILGKSV
jgi:hypothetical protein